MKLISLQYQDPVNNLQSYDFDFDKDREEINELEPLCFVGLNGSGKSKLLEIIAKVFFLIDGSRQDHSKSKITSSANFKLVYNLLPSRLYRTVTVVGSIGKAILITVDEDKKLDVSDYAEVIPSNIIGYSSGHNETISPLFLKLRKDELSLIRSSVEDQGSKGNLDLTRTLFLDRDTTKLLLLAAFLFAGQKGRDGFPTISSSKRLISKFSEFINLKQLLSFHITINTDGKRIVLSQRMENVINKLRRCSLMANVIENDKDRIYEFDFFVCEKSKEAFINQFGNAQNFFESLYELSSLNLISSTKTNQHVVFSIPEDELKVLVQKPLAEIAYRNLSDGEHQFIQIFTSLILFARDDSIFLLDEPESHFNPSWRAKFVLLIDELLGAKQKSSEFLISTHSPYLVSACKSRNVTIFKRESDSISCLQPKKETFGGTFDDLLRELFEVISPISAHSKNSIDKVIQSNDAEKMKLALALFAESPYKRDLYEAILRKGQSLELKESE